MEAENGEDEVERRWENVGGGALCDRSSMVGASPSHWATGRLRVSSDIGCSRD